MKPFIGIAKYYNNVGQSDEDVQEFIWTEDELQAKDILIREHPDAKSHIVTPFLTLNT
jgi:hypothetical protein